MSNAVEKPEAKRYTIAEYLAMEELALDKHEFHDGEILAMSGASFAHVRLEMNLSAALMQRLRGSPCQPLGSNMRVRIPNQRRYLYPDLSIVCGPPAFDPDFPKPQTLINPRVVIEISSDSTESYDRKKKFSFYAQIPDLQQYVIVSQQEPLVETFLRRDDGGWLYRAADALDKMVDLAAVNVSLPMSEIYDSVTFDPA